MQATKEQKSRLHKLLLLLGALLAGGIAYAVFCRVTGWRIPCLFYTVTGLQCPGCGVTRMCLSLLQGDLAGAWRYNPVILCLLPVGAAMAADYAVRYVRLGTRQPSTWVHVTTWILLAVLLIFAVLRNLSL